MSSGKTRALVTLKSKDVRSLSESDVLAVRSEHAASAIKIILTHITDLQKMKKISMVQ